MKNGNWLDSEKEFVLNGQFTDDIENFNCFWPEQIKKNKNDFLKRYEISIDHLPLPGAFREVLIALRGLIREKRKENLDYSVELSQLYKIAAIETFGLDYSEYNQCPGFNIFSIIPGNIVNNLKINYKTLGYQKIPSLKKTDIKWIVEKWGEPESHSNLNILYNDLWNRYEKKYEKIRKEMSAKSIDEYKKILGSNKIGIKRNNLNQSEIKPSKTANQNIILYTIIFFIFFLIILIIIFV
ncbi:hypothetical protein C0585_00635 [Candidatus Woesearchaeota archaeon]|nr:MAG: hypothetical protein C0585_00635 [Candidatus Woesearchaeota archaeon]